MPSFEDLCARRSVTDLIHVVEQLPARAVARLPMKLDDSSVAMVVLWTLLRWERTFWVVCLEEQGVDVEGLAREVDALLRQKRAESGVAGPGSGGRDPWSGRFRRELDRFVNRLLDRAEREARAMGHGYLGSEHLLLAVIGGADGPLASLLLRQGVRYQDVKDAILAVLPADASTSHDEVEEAIEVIPVRSASRPWGARWDTAAAGVPRQFGLAILFLMVTLYALLFSSMRLLDCDPVTFIVVAILVTGVGLGQMFLFGGKYPRAASIWIGGCLFPAEILAVHVGGWLLDPNATVSVDGIALAFARVVLSIPGGAFFGYLFGGLTAGVFLLLDRYAEKRAAGEKELEEDSSEGSEEGPF